MSALVEVKDICKIYNPGENEVRALDGVDLTIYENEFVAIIGHSGSGKSTLMNMLGCLDVPTSGSYYLNGQDVSRMTDDELSDIRNVEIGFIFQDFRLFPEYTVRDNILIPFYLDHRAPDEQMLHKLTEILGIAGKLHSRPAQLSGGQQQRVAIARALIANPRIVFADEPTGNLDTRTGEDTMRLLMECAAEFGQTLIVVTHNPEIAQKAQQIIKIEDGQILRGELQHEKGNLDTQ